MYKFLIFLFLSATGFAQETEYHIDPVATRYKMTGKIMYTSFSQGGQQVPDEMRNIQYPKSGFTIYVVLYMGNDQKPKIADRITTDDKGQFSVELIPGKYGFVLDYKNADKGQFLPKGYETMSEHYSESSRWEISGGLPVEIKDREVKDVLLIQHNSSICMDCP